jgi:hypothetical protein
MEPEVVPGPVPPDLPAVVLQGGDASGNELYPDHGPCDAGLPEISDSRAEHPQGFLRKGLAGPGGEFDGRDPGDEEEL